jgi:DNA-binding GntR family transcriptional regulator
MSSSLDRKAPTLAGIERRSLRQIIVEIIKGALTASELQPGQWITELGLARRFGVGQNTVREALIELEHGGFVERISPHRTRITTLTRRDTNEIYALRLPLEQLVLDHIAAGKDLDWAAAHGACDRMKAAAATLDVAEFESADLDFHRALWALADNRHLADILERLVGKLFAYEWMLLRRRHITHETFDALLVQHADVLRFLKAGDTEAAKRSLVASMDRTWEDDLEIPDSTAAVSTGRPPL